MGHPYISHSSFATFKFALPWAAFFHGVAVAVNSG
jgi:hypothetical protein